MNDPILAALKARQQEAALAAIRTPSDRSEFEYGRQCGIYAGLEMAIVAYLDLLRDRDHKDRDL